MPADEFIREAERVLPICAACMYCDALCPVFPAIAAKHSFAANELTYLANLCHNCRSCWYACQYAPPHPFAVNLPRTFAELRQQSYADYAWPRWARGGFRRNALFVTAFVGCITALAALLLVPSHAFFTAHRGAGAFYLLAPLPIMAGAAAVALIWAVLAIGVSAATFWRAIAPGAPARTILQALYPALLDIVTLRNLGGGGPGCNDRDEKFSQQRRYFHHVMAAGFGACFGSTLIAALYHHLFALLAPYPMTSLPVLLGSAGGLMMLTGVAGLLLLERSADRALGAAAEIRLNVVLLALLAAVAGSGLALLALRNTAAMGLLLTLHFGVVTGFFAALPVSKAVHAPYRSLALLRAAIERAAPRPRRGGAD